MQRDEVVHDGPVCDVIRALRRRRAAPDDQLLGWRERRRWHPLRSDEVNAYLHKMSGLDVTAKDFRTWHATVLMSRELATQPTHRSVSARRRAISHAYKTVSEQLGNTPSVLKSSYVDPQLLDRYHDGLTIEPAGRGIRAVERAVLDLLSDD